MLNSRAPPFLQPGLVPLPGHVEDPAALEIPAGDASLPQNKIKPFIAKLALALAHPELYGDIIRWGDETGSFFILAHNERLASVLLPALFGHKNAPSFMRTSLSLDNSLLMLTRGFAGQLGVSSRFPSRSLSPTIL